VCDLETSRMRRLKPASGILKAIKRRRRKPNLIQQRRRSFPFQLVN
jgi:hypothetical protein